MADQFKVLIIFAHPNREQSRVQSALLKAVQTMEDVTVVDLYNEYPDFIIDVKREQERVLEHSLLIFQHPIYWYSCPPLLKEWMDCVLELGWAYGEGGDKMKDLDFMQVISAGGPGDAYHRGGYNRFTVHELLRPFEATANLCGWRYHSPFLVQGAKGLNAQTIHDHAQRYHNLLYFYRMQGRRVLDALDTTFDQNTSIS
ncbi:MAG: NAD(P)H oxidoreductase [Proteobacteria bacterium]|nr:MAG: NAD(P)H oxidoreductase [Pseudomonadota bacterium]